MGEGRSRAEGLWINNVIKDTACFHLSVICNLGFMLRLVARVLALHVNIQRKKKNTTFLFKSETTFPGITPSPPAPFPLAFLARIAPHAHS